METVYDFVFLFYFSKHIRACFLSMGNVWQNLNGNGRGKGQSYINHLTYCIAKGEQVEIINRHHENKQFSIAIQRIQSGSHLNNLGLLSPK